MPFRDTKNRIYSSKYLKKIKKNKRNRTRDFGSNRKNTCFYKVLFLNINLLLNFFNKDFLTNLNSFNLDFYSLIPN